MADNNHQELLSQFCDITGATIERSTFFLESANWQLQLALATFYENSEPGDGMETESVARAISIDDDDDDDIEVQPQASKLQTSKKEKKSKNKYGAGGARIMTLNNMSSSDEEEDDDQRGQAFYAGGSERSGQQVLGPPRKNPKSDYVADIFKSAQESGAEVVENPHTSRSSSSRLFTGTSYRLGQTNDDHVVISEGGHANRPQSIDPVVLRLWRQGFTINDGELRVYDDPRNKDFIECVARGQLPPELRQKDGNPVEVNMEDHRHEDYKPVAPKVKPFAGKGHTLGSPTPNITCSNLATTMGTDSTESNEKQATDEVNVDSDQPITSLQIRLADGSRLTGRFNHGHTIGDLRRFLITARPQYADQIFALMTTFPNKELKEDTETIEKAGILNAVIVQRLK